MLAGESTTLNFHWLYLCTAQFATGAVILVAVGLLATLATAHVSQHLGHRMDGMCRYYIVSRNGQRNGEKSTEGCYDHGLWNSEGYARDECALGARFPNAQEQAIAGYWCFHEVHYRGGLPEARQGLQRQVHRPVVHDQVQDTTHPGMPERCRMNLFSPSGSYMLECFHGSNLIQT